MEGLLKTIELSILGVAFSDGLLTDRTALTAEIQSGQSKKVGRYMKSNGLISTSLFIRVYVFLSVCSLCLHFLNIKLAIQIVC